MTAILSALGAGVSAKQILKFLIKQSPNMGNKIQSMLAAGLTAEKILDFLKKPDNYQKMKEHIASEQQSPTSVENPLVMAEKIRQSGAPGERAGRATSALGTAAKTGLTLGGAYLAQQALSRALPDNVEVQQEAPKQPVLQGEVLPTPTAKLPFEALETGVQPPQTMPKQTAAKSGNPIIDRAKELIAGGATDADFIAKKVVKDLKIKDQFTKGAVSGYVRDLLQPKSENPDLKNATQKPPPESPHEKGSIVGTPKGVGEVEDVRQGIAKVNVNGKPTTVKVDELESEPEDFKNIKINVDTSKIPELGKSSVLWSVQLPPDRSSLLIETTSTHGNKSYRYTRKDGQPIKAEEILKLKHEIATATGEGGNLYGTYYIGEGSRGSHYAKQIQQMADKLDENGKPKSNNPDKKYWLEVFEPEYSHPIREEVHGGVHTAAKRFEDERRKNKR